MSKIVSVVVACAAIAGGTAYGLYSYTDVFGHCCGGCPSGHVNATVTATPSPCCESDAAPHDDSCADACCATKATAKASCCESSAACCPAACCSDGGSMAVAGPAAMFVSTTAKAKKSSCCEAGEKSATK